MTQVETSAVGVEVRGSGDEMTVVELAGEITGATAPALRERLPALVPTDGRLRLDMSQVTYISSAGLRVLVLLHREARERRAVIELAGLREELRFVLAATGFLDLLTLVPDQEAETGAAADGVPGLEEVA